LKRTGANQNTGDSSRSQRRGPIKLKRLRCFRSGQTIANKIDVGVAHVIALLQELADSLATSGATKNAGIPQEAARLLAPVLYPDNLLAVGGNYAGHLKAMNLEVKK
jgi:2-keto-4-pentenoate hydratase/2-oxohepta-3-ene-1,7-dioic acid hydratase in catechol pathway